MNNQVYRKLHGEIVTKDHYWFDWQNNKFVLLSSNYPCIGKKADGRFIREKVSLDDFRPLNNNEIVNEEHFEVWRDNCGNLIMERCDSFIVGRKADDVRKENSSLPEFNLYAKKTQFNFETLNILKDIEL
jgi:hypothetical protein